MIKLFTRFHLLLPWRKILGKCCNWFEKSNTKHLNFDNQVKKTLCFITEKAHRRFEFMRSRGGMELVTNWTIFTSVTYLWARNSQIWYNSNLLSSRVDLYHEWVDGHEIWSTEVAMNYLCNQHWKTENPSPTLCFFGKS